MKEYQYEAQSAHGQMLRGTLEAENAAAAQGQLAGLGLRVLSVTEAPGGRAKTRGPLGPDDFLLFNQQLAHLTAAGLPVERGLRLIAADLKSGRLRAAANEVAADLEKGVALETAFERQAGRFPPLYARLVEAGVKSGNLPALLFNLGRHLELKSRLSRALWRTLAYPVVVLVFLGVLVTFISMVILPQMHEIYKDFHTVLPTTTTVLLWVGPKIPFVAGGVLVSVLLVMIVSVILRVTGLGGAVVDWMVLPLPLVGPIVRRSLVARWCDALRVGVEAGLDLPRALALASEAVGSPRIMAESTELGKLLTQGTKIMEFRRGLIPAAVPAAIEFGSRTGDLPSTLATLARMYEAQADQRIRLLPAVVTPLLIMFIALIMGFAISAIFMPLVKLVQSVSGGS